MLAPDQWALERNAAGVLGSAILASRLAGTAGKRVDALVPLAGSECLRPTEAEHPGNRQRGKHIADPIELLHVASLFGRGPRVRAGERSHEGCCVVLVHEHSNLGVTNLAIGRQRHE